VELTEDNHRQLWMPPGMAHGFVALTDTADFLYKATDYYAPSHERSILWNDPAIGIEWPELGMPLALAVKDAQAAVLSQAQLS
jgi:dTDP-4-dehydrorhamnose 3,5-epimerase